VAFINNFSRVVGDFNGEMTRINMAFLFGALGKCPRCGNHQFDGTSLHPEDNVTCANPQCGHVCTVDEAVQAGRDAAAIKTFPGALDQL
jgi:hypothetical protein